jgi:hypothetical protein
MGIGPLLRNVRTVKEMVDAIAAADRGADSHARIGEIQRRLARAIESINDLGEDVFQLQEQNQQLRRDLADKVCPRLCVHGRRSAS